MDYDDVRAEMDDLALSMATTKSSQTNSARLEQLKQLAILGRRAITAAQGSDKAAERQRSVETLLMRMGNMMAEASRLDDVRRAGD